MLWAFTLNTEACGHFWGAFEQCIKQYVCEVFGNALTMKVKSKYVLMSPLLWVYSKLSRSSKVYSSKCHTVPEKARCVQYFFSLLCCGANHDHCIKELQWVRTAYLCNSLINIWVHAHKHNSVLIFPSFWLWIATVIVGRASMFEHQFSLDSKANFFLHSLSLWKKKKNLF